MATNFTDWYEDVLPHAPGCVPAIALDAIRKAAIQFCKETRIYQYDHPAVDVVATQATYAFVPPAGTVVTEILDAWYDDVPLDPKGRDDLGNINSNWREWDGPRPIYITQDDERNARLAPIPSVSLTGGLKMLVALKPTIAATEIEDRIYEEYREEIADGALARLYISPKKPFTDLALAAAKAQMFRTHCNLAYNKAMRGHTRGVDITFTLSGRR